MANIIPEIVPVVPVKIADSFKIADPAVRLDVWGQPLPSVTDKHLHKLRKEIIDEGIHKRTYSSADESDDESGSDNEMLMKFIPKKNKKNGKPDFDTIAYAFSLNNKVSSLRSELARTEERMRYLQLDYNNKEIKIEELTIKCSENRTHQINFNKELKKRAETIIKLENYLFYFECFFVFILVGAIGFIIYFMLT